MSRVEQLINLHNRLSAQTESYYAILGLETDCDEKAIKKAYRKLSMIVHPDNFVSESEEIQAMADNCSHLVNTMYNTLSDPTKRSYYDTHGKELDSKDYELAKTEAKQKQFIDAIFSKLPTYEKCVDGAIKQTIHPKLIYHGGKHTFEYNGEKLTLVIPKGMLPNSAFTFKHILGEGVQEHLKGDLTVICVYGNSKNVEFDKLNVSVTVKKSDVTFSKEGKPEKVKVLGASINVKDAECVMHTENTLQFKGLGLQNALFSARGDLLIKITE